MAGLRIFVTGLLNAGALNARSNRSLEPSTLRIPDQHFWNVHQPLPQWSTIPALRRWADFVAEEGGEPLHVRYLGFRWAAGMMVGEAAAWKVGNALESKVPSCSKPGDGSPGPLLDSQRYVGTLVHDAS